MIRSFPLLTLLPMRRPPLGGVGGSIEPFLSVMLPDADDFAGAEGGEREGNVEGREEEATLDPDVVDDDNDDDDEQEGPKE